jgi:hypothetical protein
MNTIELQTAITVQTFDAPATIAVGRERPEWLAVAQLAKDFGGAIHAAQISSELLGGIPQVVGERVLHRCVALGLLKTGEAGSAELSELGLAAVEQGQVFVPEERLWRFYIAEHPLLEQSLLHVEPLDDGNAHNERNELREAKRAGYGRPDDGDTTPACLHIAEESGRPLASMADGPHYVVTKAPEAGAYAEQENLRLELRWDSDAQPELVLTGKLTRPIRRTRDKGEPHPAASVPLQVRRRLNFPPALSGVSHEQVWIALAALGANLEVANLHDWRQRAGRLVMPITFAGCKPASRNSFRQDLPVPGIPSGRFSELEWLEGFDPSTLNDVELVPASEADAEPWAEWLLHQSLNHYATPERLEMMAAAARQRFEFHSPLLPTPEALLNKALANPTDEHSHFILAPYDLGLWS